MDGNNVKFSLTVKDLQSLTKIEGEDAMQMIRSLGGVKEICSRLGTSPINGLEGTENEIKLRKNIFGSNVLPLLPCKSIWQLAWEALQDTTLIILQLCALLSIGLSFYHSGSPTGKDYDPLNIPYEGTRGWIEGLGIWFSIGVIVIVTAFNDYSKERQFSHLLARINSEREVFVIRNGEYNRIPATEIVVGDICQIKCGDLVPADGLVVQSNDLLIDESSITGESKLVKKDVNSDPIILSGTQVMEGSGKIIITAIGVNSHVGKVYTLLGADSVSNSWTTILKTNKTAVSGNQSILQGKLNVLTLQIGYFGLIMATLTVLILQFHFLYATFISDRKPWRIHYVNNLVRDLTIGLTILVVAIPEGLPLAVTLSLAYSVMKMMTDHNLVRHLSACETMGNATAICCDKTGTLTTNRMTVIESYICETWRSKPPQFSYIPPTVANILVFGICVNTIYTSQILPPEGPEKLPRQIGNKTECALLGFVQDLGKNYQQIRGYFPESFFVHVYTFNADRKSMSTVIPYLGTGYRLYTKGAPDFLISKCKYVYDRFGNIRKLTRSMKERIIYYVINPMASKGLRTILLAHRDFVTGEAAMNQVMFRYTHELPWDDENLIVNDLTLISIIGIQDPVRPEVPEAIKDCQSAGITVRMVTGDNIETARFIATQCGIIKPYDDSLVIEGKDFNRIIRDTDNNILQSKFDEILPKLRVLARSSPKDKYNLVQGIINSNVNETQEIVAVTGDGTNDAPALKKADVGFAMGIAGTDVAKEASDIIITDDNFNSIVKAVMWGRNVYDSIEKFLQFQLTTNIVVILVACIGALTVRASPLKPVQMLWINLIMDTLASIALATEYPTKELLKRKPYGRTRPVISLIMFRNIIGHAVYQLVVIFVLLFYGDRLLDIPSGGGVDLGPEITPPSIHFTLIFNTLILMTLFNEINARKVYGERNVFSGILSNYVFIIIWISLLSVQVIIVQYGGEVFDTAPLTLELWNWCLLMGVGSLLWGQFLVCLPSYYPCCPYYSKNY